jgi:hypothetical protein
LFKSADVIVKSRERNIIYQFYKWYMWRVWAGIRNNLLKINNGIMGV